MSRRCSADMAGNVSHRNPRLEHPNLVSFSRAVQAENAADLCLFLSKSSAEPRTLQRIDSDDAETLKAQSRIPKLAAWLRPAYSDCKLVLIILSKLLGMDFPWIELRWASLRKGFFSKPWMSQTFWLISDSLHLLNALANLNCHYSCLSRSLLKCFRNVRYVRFNQTAHYPPVRD